MNPTPKFKEGDVVLLNTSFGLYKAKVNKLTKYGYELTALENNEPVIEEGDVIYASESMLSIYEGK